MMAMMVTGDPRPEDVAGYFRALRRAQIEIDLRLERHRHFYEREFPTRFRAQMDVRRFGPGERIVFEPYSEDMFERSRQWIGERGIFADSGLGGLSYGESIYAA